jgi:hypothetical protein
MQVKKQKWRSLLIHVTLVGSLLGGQKIYSQETRPQQNGQKEQVSLKKGTWEDIAEKETRWMKKKLKLTKEQLQSVKAINTVYAFKRKNYETTTSPNGEDNKQKIRDTLALLDKEKDDELRKVFTEKQYNLYKTKKPELIEKLKSDENENELPFLPPPPDGGY